MIRVVSWISVILVFLLIVIGAVRWAMGTHQFKDRCRSMGGVVHVQKDLVPDPVGPQPWTTEKTYQCLRDGELIDEYSN